MSPPMEMILTRFAHGLIEQERRARDGKFESVMKLNPHIRHAWEQLSYHCWSVGIKPPATVPELVTWLHKAPTQWTQPPEALGIEPKWTQPLMEDGAPTEFADSLAEVLKGETQTRLALEDLHFRKLHTLCREMGKPELYSRLRTFLIRNPILEDVFDQIEADFTWGDTVRPLLRECYEPIPLACVKSHHGKKQIALCPHCGWTLQWKRGEARCHTGGPCTLAAQGDLGLNAIWKSYQPEMQRTKEGIQRYVVAPEVLLIQLHDRLSQRRGVICALFPEFDAYDLLIRWDGGAWAVDLKDHKHPARLARKLPPFARYPHWERAFYVFPDYRASISYLEAFSSCWRAEPNVEYLKLSAFIHLVNQEIAP